MKSIWYVDLAQSPEQVWSYLTEPSHLGHWFDPGAAFELQSPGHVQLPGGTQFRGALGDAKVTRVDPGRRIEFHWPVFGIDTRLAWEIELRARARVSTRLNIICEYPDGDSMQPPRSNMGVLKHYWARTSARSAGR